MYALGQESIDVPAGISVEEAGNIAEKNVMMMVAGTAVMFWLIYKFLIK